MTIVIAPFGEGGNPPSGPAGGDLGGDYPDPILEPTANVQEVVLGFISEQLLHLTSLEDVQGTGVNFPGPLTIDDGFTTIVDTYPQSIGPYGLGILVNENPPAPAVASNGATTIPGIFAKRIGGVMVNTPNGVLFDDALLLHLEFRNGFTDAAVSGGASYSGCELDIQFLGATISAQHVHGYFVELTAATALAGTVVSLSGFENTPFVLPQGGPASLVIASAYGAKFARAIYNTVIPAVALNATNVLTRVGAGGQGFPDVLAGMYVTDAAGTTNFPAGTKVVSTTTTTCTLNQAVNTTVASDTVTFNFGVTSPATAALYADSGQIFFCNGQLGAKATSFGLVDSVSGTAKWFRTSTAAALVISNNVNTVPVLQVSDTGLLTVGFGSNGAGGLIATSPSASTSSPTITAGTPYHNVATNDVFITGTIAVSSATAGVIGLGVGSTNTPTTAAIIPAVTLATTTYFPFSAYVPAGYFLLINTSGTIVVSSITAAQMPV